MRIAFISFLSFCLASMVAAQDALEIDGFVVELAEDVGGLNRSSYANDWWQWAAAVSDTESPITDVTGANCAMNQKGSVWYLAGGYGTSLIERTCIVPKDNFIFFPVINMLSYPPRGSQPSCDEMKAAAAENNEKQVYLRVSLDGSELQNAERFRVASSDCFNLAGRSPIEGAPLVSPSATDGYWIMLRPLPPGKHKLEFQASYSNFGALFGEMAQDITYNLTVLED